MRILFDKNVPVAVRGFLRKHKVRTVVEMQWPDQLDNGELVCLQGGDPNTWVLGLFAGASLTTY